MVKRKVVDALTELSVGLDIGSTTNGGLRLSSLNVNIPLALDEISQMVSESLGDVRDTRVSVNGKVDFKETNNLLKYRASIIEKLKEKGFKL